MRDYGGTSIDIIQAVLDVPKNVLRERSRELNLPLREEENNTRRKTR